MPTQFTQLGRMSGILALCLCVLFGYAQPNGQGGQGNGPPKDPNITFVEPGVSQVGRYEKLELGIEIPSNVQQDVDLFFQQVANGVYPNTSTNPYNPEQINIQITFTHQGSGTIIKRDGFYYDEFKYELTTPLNPISVYNLPEKWVELNTDHHWRVRFAPTELGLWLADLTITWQGNVVYQSTTSTFIQCINSSNPGYVKFNKESNFMSFSNDEPFFPVGHGNAVINRDFNQYTFFPAEYYFNRKFIENLAGKGNYTRISLDDGYFVEQSSPGYYGEEQNSMWELDRAVELMEDNGIYFNLELTLYSQYIPFPEYDSDAILETRDWWSFHPYNKPHIPGQLQGAISYTNNPLASFFSNPEARKLFRNRLRYVVARWGYSTNLTAYDLMGELDNALIKYNYDKTAKVYRKDFDEPAENVTPGISFQARDWVDEMSTFLKDIDKNHLVTVCLAEQAPLPFGQMPEAAEIYLLEVLDYTSFDDYSSTRNSNIYDYATGNVYGRWGRVNTNKPVKMRQHGRVQYGKPVEITEIGGTQADQEMFDPVNFHNDLWASSFMGTFSSGNYFFNWYISDVGLPESGFHYSNVSPTLSIYSKTVNYTEPGGVTVSHTPYQFFWPPWYLLEDDNSNPLTPDYTDELSFLNGFMNQTIPSLGLGFEEGEFTSRKFPDDGLAELVDYIPGNELESIYLVGYDDGTNDHSVAIGWAHNRSSYWGNLRLNTFCDHYSYDWLNCPAESYNASAIGDNQDDNVTFVQNYAAGDVSFEIEDLVPNEDYTVSWYNTQLAAPISTGTQSATSDGNGVLSVSPPNMGSVNGVDYPHDYAFVVRMQKGNKPKNTAQSISRADVTIMPNPTNGTFNIALKDAVDGEISIYDVSGRIVYQGSINGQFKTIKLEQVESGIYHVRINTGSELITKQVIVQ